MAKEIKSDSIYLGKKIKESKSEKEFKEFYNQKGLKIIYYKEKERKRNV